MRLSSSRPLTIAHRAGNSLVRAIEACGAGADLIELDVWLYRGRLEVRHTKTIRGLPLLWDRWSLEPGWRPRLLLHELLSALPPETGLMLDLKGSAATLPDEVLAGLGTQLGARPIAICTRNWGHVDSLDARKDLTAIYSVGRRHLVRPLLDHLSLRGERSHRGVSIHKRLLTPGVMRELAEKTALVMTWPVNAVDEASSLIERGVVGIISDDLDVVRRISSMRDGVRYTSSQ